MNSGIETKHFSSWIDSRQSEGLYFFTKEKALESLPLSQTAFKSAAHRLARKKRIARIRSGFYVIVPLEYAPAGMIPPDWFINDLMAYLEEPYYVGLLSAAALQGAGHQQPQQFQVVTTANIPNIALSNLAIRFFKRKHFKEPFITRLKVRTGYINISTPEATAFDLIHYARWIGGLDRAATVLKELSNKLDQKKLTDTAKAEGDLACAQRLGWILENHAHYKAGTLETWLSHLVKHYAKLDPSSPAKGVEKDMSWHILINAKIEADI